MFNYLPEQAIACFLLYLLTNIQTASSNQPAVATKGGVLFNLHQKILLTEKFVKTEILVPYPVYNKTVESKLTNLTRELESMWTSKNYGCPLNYTNKTESTSGLQWIAKQAIMENELAQQDIESLKIEMLQHFHTPQRTQLFLANQGQPPQPLQFWDLELAQETNSCALSNRYLADATNG